MPFRSARYQGTFTPTELHILQMAFNRCCELLDRCPTTHEGREDLARIIIQTFESGKNSPEEIAAVAAKMELLKE
ncbi:hypothetical protein H7Q97_07780 [Ochrobactrum sp. CM-21-5]|nr:hypothetical protein [Ochrobactrum sp. CM-21-5]